MKYLLSIIVGILIFLIIHLVFAMNVVSCMLSVISIVLSLYYFSSYDGGIRETLLGKDFDYEKARQDFVSKWKGE